ncbi:MAG: DUF4236 domain-containing protein [Campylobacteraceae bacterium]|nr:DUF4236 domain-containing protein [Campylobacteraceae bacterium]
MGFRFRKSINLGGGFRINISKSGIGYSWGTKGYRITRTATGRTRRTAFIPGTGISYVDETRKNNRKQSNFTTNPVQQPTPIIDNNHYDTVKIENNIATEMVSEGLEEMLALASKAILMRKLSIVGVLISLLIGFFYPIFFVVALLFVVLLNYVETRGIIELEYDIDEDQQDIVNGRINPMVKITECKKVWRITETSKVIDSKYAAGASSTVGRISCNATTKAPFPFRSNVKVASFKTRKETILFLPDKLFIFQGSKIGALNYSDISSHAYTRRFIEEESVPKDAQVVDKTWQYVNKSGGPDRRFKNNKQIPVCLYGKLKLTSLSGLNTVIMFSNPDVVRNI